MAVIVITVFMRTAGIGETVIMDEMMRQSVWYRWRPNDDTFGYGVGGDNRWAGQWLSRYLLSMGMVRVLLVGIICEVRA